MYLTFHVLYCFTFVADTEINQSVMDLAFYDPQLLRRGHTGLGLSVRLSVRYSLYTVKNV